METQCTGEQLEFHPLGRRSVSGRFDGGRISSDAGGVLLREVDKRTGLTARVARCFVDYRNPASVEHNVHELVSQRLYAMALGDPKEAANHRYKRIVARPEALDELLVEFFVESHSLAPREIWLDLDATDDPLHGHQEVRLFHGYYRCYCYLPLYIFCGEHLLCARLRPSNLDASAGCLEELERVVAQLRRHWPKTRINIRGDSGFCRESVMKWCEDHGVGFALGLARNQRLVRAQCSTLRLKLLKIRARIKITIRRVWLSFSEAYAYAETFTRVRANLQKHPVRKPS